MVRITVEKPKQDAKTVSYDAPAELTVGRSADCAYCLDFDPLVSRMHAVFIVDPPSVRIKDLHSTNGITINGELYGAVNNRRLIQPLELRGGDVVQIGKTRFIVGDIDSGMDLGPELQKIKAEQAAESADSARFSLPRFPASQDTVGRPLMTIGTSGASRARESYETIADAASVSPEIPGYRVERFLAAGRAGNVYKARPAAGGAAVVLKVVSGALTRQVVEDFRRGMEDARKLSHKGLAELRAFGEVGRDTLYTISEYVNGESLASYLPRCPGNKIPLPVALDLFRQMTKAVAYLHGRDIVHREIHPAGIMLHDDNGKLRTKFTEGALFRFWADSVPGACPTTPDDAGRLGYLAPEELHRPPEAKPSADVFSLGCVLYHMLSGRVPYEFGAGASPARVVEEARIRPIEELAAGVPETVAVVAERALAPEPEMRYASAAEMLEAVEMISDRY